MPERSTSTDSYRYAYNGMEMDNEVSGNGNSYTTEFRQFDARLGRWKSLDPLMGIFPHMSPYVAFDNNPIYYTDIYGLSAGNGDDDGIGGDFGDKRGPGMMGDHGGENIHYGWDYTSSKTSKEAGVSGVTLNIPINSDTKYFSDANGDGYIGFPNTGVAFEGVERGQVRSFVGQDGYRYTAGFKPSGEFTGYKNNGSLYDNKEYGNEEIIGEKLDQALTYLGEYYTYTNRANNFEAPQLESSRRIVLESFMLNGERFEGTVITNSKWTTGEKYFDKIYLSETSNNYAGKTMPDLPQVAFYSRYPAGKNGFYSRDGDYILKITFKDTEEWTRFIQYIHDNYGIDGYTPYTSKSVNIFEILKDEN